MEVSCVVKNGDAGDQRAVKREELLLEAREESHIEWVSQMIDFDGFSRKGKCVVLIFDTLDSHFGVISQEHYVIWRHLCIL